MTQHSCTTNGSGDSLKSHRVPQGQLPLTHSAEACGQDLPVGEEHSSHGSGALVNLLSDLEEEDRGRRVDGGGGRGRRGERARTDLEDGASSWVDDAQRFVLAHGADGASRLVPADAVDQVWVGVVQLVHQLPGAHVPHEDHVVTAWREDEDQ